MIKDYIKRLKEEIGTDIKVAKTDHEKYDDYIEKNNQYYTTKNHDRIIIKESLPKVNKDLAESLIRDDFKKKKKSKKHTSTNPMNDDRFSSMFENKDFEIDIQSNEYKRLNPHGGRHLRLQEQREQQGELYSSSTGQYQVDNSERIDDDSNDSDDDSDENI